MRHSLRLAPLAALLFCSLAACEASTSSSGSNDPNNPNDPGPSPTPTNPGPMAQSSQPRTAASSVPAASLAGAVTANNAFAVDLYQQALSTTAGASAGNFLTSPISASLALTMTYAGAQGTTAAQMASALHFSSSTGTIFAGQNALSQALGTRAAQALSAATTNAQENQAPAPDPSDFALQVVNSVWGEQTYTWNQPFLDTLAEDYGTGVRLADFVNQPDPSRVTINGWVSTETANKINNLIPQGAIDDSTRMVLVNAIHLKFPWANPFQATETQPATFTTGAGKAVSTPFMNQSLYTSYTDDGQAQIVGLPLEGGQLSVVITLPHGDLATYVSGLTPTSAALSQPTKTTNVQLSLPKFTFTSPTFSLAKALQAMGMTQAFDAQNANFTGLCTSPPDGDHLYIGDVLQKAMIAVQETGVEAAAATAVLLAGASAEEQVTTVNVNRPFLVSIVDVTTGAVLFFGQIQDPTDAGGS